MKTAVVNLKGNYIEVFGFEIRSQAFASPKMGAWTVFYVFKSGGEKVYQSENICSCIEFAVSARK